MELMKLNIKILFHSEDWVPPYMIMWDFHVFYKMEWFWSCEINIDDFKLWSVSTYNCVNSKYVVYHRIDK